MTSFSFEADDAKLLALLKQHGPAFQKAAKTGMRHFVRDWTKDVRNRFSGYYAGKNRTGSSPRGRLRNSSAALKSSIGGRVEGSVKTGIVAFLRAGAGNSNAYAAVQEFGTVGAGGTLPDIKSKSGGWLTIPTRNALTGAGNKKSNAILKKVGGSWVTDMGPTFIKRFGSTPVIFAKKGKRGKAIAIYTLRKSVAIPPRLGAGYSFNSLQAKAVENIADKFTVIAEGGT